MAVDVAKRSALRCLAYRRVRPSARLAEFVRYYEYTDRVADGTVACPFAVSLFPALVFYLGEPCLAYEHDAERTRQLPPVIALGLCDHRVADVLDRGHPVNFTVMFEPTGFHRLFHQTPWALRNYAHDASEVLGPGMAAVHARLRETDDVVERVRIVEEALLARVSAALPPSRMQKAAQQLLGSRGAADLSALAASFGLSDSSWRRHFVSEIGMTPKRYQRMLRFQHAVALKRDRPALTWTRVCQEAGYYDQSHFIAEFRELGGAAPSRFMDELARVPLAVSRSWYAGLTDPYNRSA